MIKREYLKLTFVKVPMNDKKNNNHKMYLLKVSESSKILYINLCPQVTWQCKV